MLSVFPRDYRKSAFRACVFFGANLLGMLTNVDSVSAQPSNQAQIMAALSDHACSTRLEELTNGNSWQNGATDHLFVGMIPYSANSQNGRPTAFLTRGYTVRLTLPIGQNKANDYVVVHVPAFFVMDFFSRPGPLQPFSTNLPRYREASVIHDWLYAIGTNGNSEQRELADHALATYASVLHGEENGRVKKFFFLKKSTQWFGARPFGRTTEFRIHDPSQNRQHCILGQLNCVTPWEPKEHVNGYLPEGFVALTTDQRNTLWDISVATETNCPSGNTNPNVSDE